MPEDGTFMSAPNIYVRIPADIIPTYSLPEGGNPSSLIRSCGRSSGRTKKGTRHEVVPVEKRREQTGSLDGPRR